MPILFLQLNFYVDSDLNCFLLPQKSDRLWSEQIIKAHTFVLSAARAHENFQERRFSQLALFLALTKISTFYTSWIENELIHLTRNLSFP